MLQSTCISVIVIAATAFITSCSAKQRLNSTKLESKNLNESLLFPTSSKRTRIGNARIKYLIYDHSDESWVRMPRRDEVPIDLWNFNGSLKLLFHGFNARINRDPMKVMESMLIVGREYAKKNASLNIVAVDWTILATRPAIQYPEAAKNTNEAGTAVGKYLVALKTKKAFTHWRKVHMIGFSLGAHVAGIAGQEVQRLTRGRKVGRITGLDPAGPEFDKFDLGVPSDTSGMLDKSDARYVDIIHCNMGPPPTNLVSAVLTGRFGSTVQAGHADFYPNGGERQFHQCDEIQDRTIACSHNMCALFFALSITVELPACPCKSWTYFTAGLCSCWTGDNGKAEYMGDLSNRRGTARGKYFLVVENKVNVKYFTQ